MAEYDRRWYVSLNALKAELGVNDTTQDARLGRLIERASRWIEWRTGRWFIPVTQTRRFDFQDAYKLRLDQDLLSVSELTNGDGAVLTSDDYYLYPLSGPPYAWIEVKRDAGKLFAYSGTAQRAISIAGRWGYSEQYTDTGATLNGAISSLTATTFTASNGALIEVGWSLLIDSEQMFVTNVSTNTVTVRRGNNGTTAATHSSGAAIYRYVPDPSVEEAAAMLAVVWNKWRQESRSRTKTVGDFTVVYDAGWPIPTLVLDTVAQLRRPLVR